MRILYLHQYFITRSGVGGTRSYEFARFFVKRGHAVTMITAGQSWRRHTLEGIDVLEVAAGYSDYVTGTARGYLSRVLAFIRFAIASCWAVLREPKPDVVFATSTPLTIGVPALLASKFHGVPLVFEVRDLWPEAPIQLGALRNGFLIAAAKWLERLIYRNSTHIVALSPGMRDGVLATGIAEELVSVIPNASDLELFSPNVEPGEFRDRLGVNGNFVCTYFGTMGEANDLVPVLEAARLLQDRNVRGITFVLHGNGKRRPALRAYCEEHQLRNVVFSEPIKDKHAIAKLAAASDVCLTIYKNLPILYTCSPNKLFDTFAAGRPAIVNSPGWLRELVEENQAGLYAKPDDPEDFARQVVFLRDHPEIAAQYGRNARALAERTFDRQKLAAQLLSILERVA